MPFALSKELRVKRSVVRVLLLGAIASGLTACLVNRPAQTNGATQTEQSWSYSQFVSAIQDDTLNKIRITADRTQATFEAPDGSGQVIVLLPEDPGLLDLLIDNEVDLQVQP